MKRDIAARMSSLVGVPVEVAWSEDAPYLAGPHCYYLRGYFLPDKFIEWTMTEGRTGSVG